MSDPPWACLLLKENWKKRSKETLILLYLQPLDTYVIMSLQSPLGNRNTKFPVGQNRIQILEQSYSVCYAAAFSFALQLAETNYINDRGVKIDTELVQQAIACDLMLSDAMSKKAYELTGLENPNSVSQLKSWLDERGIPMDTLGKKDVAQMTEELDKNGVDAEAMDMLKLRLQMAKSSVKKYQAAERCVCSDSRARGLFQFYGASRTGRYSGRNIQLQNLPQNHISTLDEARKLVKLGCFDMVETIYGNTPDVLSQLIRTMLIPKEGCEFIVADFSAIEARVLAWEAGEDWRLEAFLEGKDIYCASASQMFHKRSAGKFSKCYGGYYREYSVNAKVARAIKTVFYALDVVNQGMQEKQSITVRCVDIEDLEKQAEAIRVEQIKLYESYADGVLLRDAYIEKKKTLSEKLAALQDLEGCDRAGARKTRRPCSRTSLQSLAQKL